MGMPVLSLTEVEFGRFPTFFGNKRTSGMEIGSFGVVYKTFVMKRFSRNEVICGMQGNGLNGSCKTTVKSPLKNKEAIYYSYYF